MPSIREEITIPYALADVWPLLSDPALVASCIPGATLSPDQSDGLWRGSVRVKFGPTVAVFRGEAKLEFDHAAHRCTIEGRGIDGRGASRALASGLVVASGQDTTQIAIDGTFNVTGPLETFANAGGVHVARALLQEFSANIVKVIAERQGAPEPAAAPAVADIQQVSRPQTASTVAIKTEAAQSNVVPLPVSARRPAAAAEISAFRIAWLALKSWFNDLIGKGTKRS
jgi:carbon monoxide dehydrogenase subunit G